MSAQSTLELGPCRVSFAGRDVGETAGTASVTLRALWRERRSERYGATPVERVAVGVEAKAVVRLSEKSAENLAAALPGATISQGVLTLSAAPGTRASAGAGELRLHPLDRSDTTRDVVIHRAVAIGLLELEYGPGRRRHFEVEFVGLADTANAGRVAAVNCAV